MYSSRVSSAPASLVIGGAIGVLVVLHSYPPGWVSLHIYIMKQDEDFLYMFVQPIREQILGRVNDHGRGRALEVVFFWGKSFVT